LGDFGCISSCLISFITLTRSWLPFSPTVRVLFKDPPPVMILVSPAFPIMISGLEIGETGPGLIGSIGIYMLISSRTRG